MYGYQGLLKEARERLGLGPEELSRCTGIPVETVRNPEKSPENRETLVYLTGMLALLLHAGIQGSEEQYAADLIRTLRERLGIPYEKLASFAEVEPERVTAFLENPASLPEKTKYRLSMIAFHLFSTLTKNPYVLLKMPAPPEKGDSPCRADGNLPGTLESHTAYFH